METIRLKLKIRTPLIISSGEILCPFDYYIEEGDNNRNHCFVLNLENFIEEITNLGDMNLELFMNLFLEEIRDSIENNKFTKNMKEILESIGKRNFLIKNFNYNFILEKSKRFSFSTMSEKDNKTTLELPILTKENKPYIPGSSIKGALKTALFFKYISEKKEKNDVQKLSDLLKEYLGIKANMVGKKNDKYLKEKLKDNSKKINNMLNIIEAEMKNINFMVRDVPLENFSFEIYRIQRANRKKFIEKRVRFSSAIFIKEGEGIVEISYDDKMGSNFKKIYPNFTNFKELLFKSMKEFYNEVSSRISVQWNGLVTPYFSEESIPLQLGKYGNLYTKSIAVSLLDEYYGYPKTISYIEYNNQKVQPGWIELTEV